MPELTAKPLIQKGSIVLDPSPDRHMIHGQPTLAHHLLQIAVAERIPQVPPHAENNDDLVKVSPSEQRWPALDHRFTTRMASRESATDPFPMPSILLSGWLRS
jgi:hypothetical protein